MPTQKSEKPAQTVVKPAAKKTSSVTAKSATKAKPVPASKTTPKTDKATEELKKTPKAEAAAEDAPKKKPGRPAKTTAAKEGTGAKRGRKPKNAAAADAPSEEDDLSDIEAEFAEEPAPEATPEKVKPLRMKISKAKERALMKEFGLDETVLTEEEMLKRRQRLKTLIKLGKTRGYLTHAEISDHLPDKLVDAETLEVVISMLNDMGVAVYEQTPDAETLLLTNTGPTAATEEEA